MSDVRITGDGSTNVGGIKVNTPYESKEDRGVKVEDFLQLMIAQLSNQDFMNPADDTQYVTQLAQFATMQSMQELSQYSQTNYVMSLVGKSVTAASYGLGGTVNREVGIVSKVNLSGDDFTVTVNGKEFKLSQLMSINDSSSAVSASELDVANKMAVIPTDTGTNSVSLRWDAPISDKERAGELRYDVYYTENGNLDFTNLATVKKGTKVDTDLRALETTITGLEPGKTYFVNVVVRNNRGEEAVYSYATVKTKTE